VPLEEASNRRRRDARDRQPEVDPYAARRLRREEARRRTRRQRRIVAVLAGLALAAGVAVIGLALGDSDEAKAPAARAAPPPELPGGGRRIFPDRRVVAFYGAPQHEELGALGVGPPAAAGRRLARQARPYRRGGRPVLPAFELIATIVQSAPGEEGDHSQRQSPRTIRRYLRAARAAGALLILDVQPGRAPFIREVRAFRSFLEEPDVSVALDPEWSMAPGQVPGQQIGSTDAATVNQVSRYMSQIVREGDLPQKLLVVHRFTHDVLRDEARLERHPGVALTVNVDGFGDRANKIAKYRELTAARGDRHHGLKLFYDEDTNLMHPRRVLRLHPRPELIVYE
jgi:hypothetical protein